MRPATIVALGLMVAVIFVPVMFLDVDELKKHVPAEEGLTPPPIYGAPTNQPVAEPPLNLPANQPAEDPPDDEPKD